jgi:hypothetical protein
MKLPDKEANFTKHTKKQDNYASKTKANFLDSNTKAWFTTTFTISS